MRIEHRIRAVTVVALVATLILSGCGGDDGDTSAESSPAADDSSDDAAPDSDESSTDAPAESGDGTDEAGDSDDQGPTGYGTEDETDGDSGEAGGGEDGADDGGGGQGLVPPGVVSEADVGNGTLYRSEAPFDDVVAHYDSVMGDANFVNAEEVSAVWVSEIDGVRRSVNLSAGDEGLLTILVASIG